MKNLNTYHTYYIDFVMRNDLVFFLGLSQTLPRLPVNITCSYVQSLDIHFASR